jgi:hypothetical protein
MFAALALTVLCPQGPVGVEYPLDARDQLRFPTPTQTAYVVPFTDSLGQPQRVTIAAGGLADLDGDDNRDAWFLAGAGGRLGELSVQGAQTAGLGRYVPRAQLPAGPWVSAATFRRAGVPDVVLLADPTRAPLDVLFYQPGVTDPRAGAFLVQPSIWSASVDTRSLATFDADDDGHDDLLATIDLRSGSSIVGTRFLVQHYGMGPMGHGLLATAAIDLPLPGLRALPADLDGDGSTDLVIHADGLGVAGFCADGAGGFAIRTFVGLGFGTLADCAIADFDDDGRDDQALLTAIGAIVVFTNATGDTQRALLSPTYVGPLGALAAVDADGDKKLDLVGLPKFGGNLAVWRFVATSRNFRGGEVLTPPAGAVELHAGNGALGQSTVVDDFDHDGDRDVLWQIPTGDRWIALASTSVDVSPLQTYATMVGPLSPLGFQLQHFTIPLPAEFHTAGITTLEFALFVTDQSSGEQVYWDRDLVTIQPGTTSVTVPIQIMIDTQNSQWLWQSRVTRHPLTGELTAFGDTVITVHGKAGPRRFASAHARWDGHGLQGGPNGSAVGVRWNIVAAPPLPKSDQQLLPWN